MHNSASEYSCFCSASKPSWLIAGIHTCNQEELVPSVAHGVRAIKRQKGLHAFNASRHFQRRPSLRMTTLYLLRCVRAPGELKGSATRKQSLPVSAHGNAWLTCRQLRFARGFIACPICQKACLSRERSSIEVMVLMSSKADLWANDAGRRSRSIHKYT